VGTVFFCRSITATSRVRLENWRNPTRRSNHYFLTAMPFLLREGCCVHLSIRKKRNRSSFGCQEERASLEKTFLMKVSLLLWKKRFGSMCLLSVFQSLSGVIM